MNFTVFLLLTVAPSHEWNTQNGGVRPPVFFLHRDHATPTHYVITLKTGFNGDFFILAV